MENKRRDLRILWNSNSTHSNSGYSIQTRDVLYRLALDGWKVAISAFYGVDGGPTEIAYPSHLNPKLKGITIKHYPKMSEPWGSDGMFYHGANWKANVVFSMQDVWTLDPSFLSRIPVWIPFVPIDKEPLPINVIQKLNFAYKILSFSKFGHEELMKHGFSSTMIYEGTDIEIFKPQDKTKMRDELKLPQDKFIFSMVGANKENPPRKGYQEAIEAFALFLKNHPDSALLFHVQQRSPTGFPIQQFTRHLGIQKSVFFIDDYSSMFMSTSDTIAKEYNAADALLHPSQTEGFGLCIIEAQACGKPVIVQRCQSMPELVIEGKTGFIAETLYKRYTPDLSYVNTADVRSVHECMEKTYKMVTENENKVRTDCRNWIVENFNIDTIVDKKWIPLLEKLQDELLTDTGKKSTIKEANT